MRLLNRTYLLACLLFVFWSVVPADARADVEDVVNHDIVITGEVFRFAENPFFRKELQNKIQLIPEKPMYVWRQPDVGDALRLYGLLTIGDKAHNQFAFILDFPK